MSHNLETTAADGEEKEVSLSITGSVERNCAAVYFWFQVKLFFYRHALLVKC